MSSSIPAFIPDLPSRLPTPPSGTDRGSTMSDSAMRAAAAEFEAVFIGEMLRYSGLADVPEAFGGGQGEAAFADMMIDEYARSISASHSFGIAEQVYRSLRERAGE